MLAWPAPVRSAVYIDFENFPIAPDALASWIAWLEDGRFHHGRRRRLLVRRVYWNSAAERNRDRYEAAGFDVVLCDKYANRKNGADIRMAVDIVEAIHTLPKLDEFILVTVDSDFVPVLQRLQARGKRSVVLVDEQRPDLHTICRRHADVLIPLRRLGEARQYQRVPGRAAMIWSSLVGRAARRVGLPSAGEGRAAIPATATRAGVEPPAEPSSAFLGRSVLAVSPVAGPGSGPPSYVPAARSEAAMARTTVPLTEHLQPKEPAEPPCAVLAETPPTGSRRLSIPSGAVEIVIKTMSKRTGDYIARSKVIRALREVPGFAIDGKNAFFGYGSYQEFMLEMARIEPRLRCDASGNGFSAKLMPAEPADTRKSAWETVDTDWHEEWETCVPPEPWIEPGDWQSTMKAAAEAPAAEAAVYGDGSGRKSETALPALRVVSNDR